MRLRLLGMSWLADGISMSPQGQEITTVPKFSQKGLMYRGQAVEAMSEAGLVALVYWLFDETERLSARLRAGTNRQLSELGIKRA